MAKPGLDLSVIQNKQAKMANEKSDSYGRDSINSNILDVYAIGEYKKELITLKKQKQKKLDTLMELNGKFEIELPIIL
jgi:hypothetical protein